MSDRPLNVHPAINFPTVDPEVLCKQQKIFIENWPSPSEQARTLQLDFFEMYTDILSFHLPNFLGARRTVESALNLPQWETRLYEYHDNEICYYLHYGWPVGYHSSTIPTSVLTNHPSATAHPSHIRQFLDKELSHAAIVGPFQQQPFDPWVRLSPMMTRPKKNSANRRVIIDLSFPEGTSVNDRISIDSIYGRDSRYTLPTINDLTTYVQRFEKSSWIGKAGMP